MIRKVTKEKKLKSKMILSFLTVGIIPLVIFATISNIITRISMYKSQISSLKQISSMVTKNLDEWGDDNILLAEDIANSQVMHGNNIESIQTELKNKQAQNSTILNIMYTDTDGNVLADAMGSVNKSISSKQYFTNVAKGYSYVSDVFLDEEKNIPFMVFSSPVKNDNEVIGYVINEVKMNGVEESIGKILFSDKGRIYTFNNDGYVTYDRDLEKVMNENVLKISDDLSEGVFKALAGNFNRVEYEYEGEKVAGIYNYIPSLDWGTMITIPKNEIYAAFNQILIIAIILIVIIIAVVTFIALSVSKGLSESIANLADVSNSIADGDLTKECNIHGAEEITNIGKDFNEMIKSLKNIVFSIQNESEELKTASALLNEMSTSAEETSKDIAKAMEEISDGSVQQAAKTDDLLNHVRKLDNKMKELTEELNETNDALKVSEKALIKGNNETKELKDNTLTQYKLVGQTVDEVTELAEYVGNIDRIIETISEIAEQTSLLALNASIEAARAGEAGKGFAVVAEEVGSLANESQNATNQITAILNNIRNKADSTTRLMESINEGMNTQSSKVEETLVSFEEITHADSKIADNIKSFNKLIDFINIFSNELLELIETLASSAEESAAVAEEVTASSEDQILSVQNVKKEADNIAETVRRLQISIEKFKTE